MSNIEEQINLLAKKQKRKIAFGLKEINDQILSSLDKAKEFADIVLVTPENLKEVPDFEVISVEKPEEKIASMLVNKEVDGIIRGTIDDFKTLEAYCNLTGVKKEIAALAPAVLKDAHGRLFFMNPISNPEGWDKEEKLKAIIKIANYAKKFGIKPKIGVLTGERHETYQRKKDIKEGVTAILNKTYEDAEFVVKGLKEKGFEAKNYAIEINSAADEGCNIIVPANGMIGNQIIRTIVFLGGGQLLYGPRIALKHPYEDNSRNEKDYLSHVKFVVAWANSLEKK